MGAYVRGDKLAVAMALGDRHFERAAAAAYRVSPGADVAGLGLVQVQFVGRGEPSLSAAVAGVGQVLVQMWQGRARSQGRCGRG